MNNYASFMKRFLSVVIDFLILIIPMAILQTQIPYISGFFVALFYKPIFEASPLQATPGKIMSGIAVTNLSGGTLTFQQAFIRFGASIVSGLFLGFGYWMALFTAKKQTFHDMIAETIVVDRKRGTDSIPYFDIWLLEIKKLFSVGPASSPSPISGNSEDSSAPARASTVAQDLEKLNELLNSKLITEDEYKQKRAEVLKRI